MLKYLLIFGAVFIADIVWTIYIRALAQNKALTASIFSALVYILTAVSFVEVVKDMYMLIPAVFGAFAGTFATMKLGIENERSKKNKNSD